MKEKFIKILDLFISILVYSLILITFSIIFNDTLYIDNGYFGLIGVLAASIIFFLNRTIKPLIVWLTLPITALTLGLFYPVINFIILKITDLILGNLFEINGYLMPLIVATLISLAHLIMDHLIHNLLERKKYE